MPPPKPQPDSTCSSISSPANVNNNTPTPLPSLSTTVQPSSSTSQGSKLAARAEALAKMTFELNMRAVNAQTDRLSRDVQALVQSTGEDKEFREKHESRLQNLWQEILAVKHQMTNVDGEGQKQASDIKADFEKCQLETKSLISEFQCEIQDLRKLVDELSKQLDELPASGITDSLDDSGYKSQQSTKSSMEEDSSLELKREDSLNTQNGWGTKTTESYVDELAWLGHDADAVAKASHRVVEAIKSTRRWHRDYKKSKLSDAEFTANYLRQQSKRDAPLAVHIQKSILRELRRGNNRLVNAHPRSLQEFCQDVKWQDVIDTVQNILVENKKSTIIEMLSAGS